MQYNPNIGRLLANISSLDDAAEDIIRVSTSGEIIYPDSLDRDEDDELGLIDAELSDETEYEDDEIDEHEAGEASRIVRTRKEEQKQSVSSTTPTQSQMRIKNTTHIQYALQEADELMEPTLSAENVLSYPPEDHQKELGYLSDLASLMQRNWKERIICGYTKYLNSVTSRLTERTTSKLHSLFISLFDQRLPLLDYEENVFNFYRVFALESSLHSFFAYLALSLILTSASESSCELIFSRAKWVVGDRRMRFTIPQLSGLLKVLMNNHI